MKKGYNNKNKIFYLLYKKLLVALKYNYKI